MKRLAIKLVVFLLLGAIVNIAVAWGCAVRVRVHHTIPNGSHYPIFTATQLPRWSVYWYERRGAIRYVIDAVDFEGTQDDLIVSLPSWVDDDGAPIVQPGRLSQIDESPKVYDARGWPQLSLACQFETGSGPQRGFAIDVHQGVPLQRVYRGENTPTRPFIVGPDFDYATALPLRPIFPGFAINTLFYALVLWLLWSAPFATRRIIRKRFGRCINCGYDLRGTFNSGAGGAEHGVCPECGSRRERR